MIRFLTRIPALGMVLFAASCMGPSTRDTLGHRPGPSGFRKVVIDAGHGGRDSGAISRHTGAKEKDLTLDLARRLRLQLGKSGMRTVMLRNDDRFVDLDERVRLANRHHDAVLVSLHFNSGPASIRGPECYFWRVDSHGLAVRIQRELESVSPCESGNRGLVRRRLRLTRNPEIPCLLVEGGYLSHATESRLVTSPRYRESLAAAICRAIVAQSSSGDHGTGPLPPPIDAPPSRPDDVRE